MTELHEMHELTEKMEHATPVENKFGQFGVIVGVTIATLGVLLALCSALVGGQRTALIASMVEQSSAGTRYQALSTRHRVLLAQLQQLHALIPDIDKFKAWDKEVRQLTTELTSPDNIKLARIIRLENAKNLSAEIPTEDDLKQFTTMINRLEERSQAAMDWTNSFDAKIIAHSIGGEHYEWAQLAAEVGIVVASIALLFMSRIVWFCSVCLGVATIFISSTTYLTISSQLNAASQKIAKAKSHFDQFNAEDTNKVSDDILMKSIRETPAPTIDPI